MVTLGITAFGITTQGLIARA
ncbi:MAG: hypothetical protein DME56_07780, partial [Verrucomicrobia bacterium]